MAPKSSSGRRKSGGKSQAPAQATGTVPQAKTIAEANQLAVSLGLARQADFTGVDVSIANEMIQELAETKTLLSIRDSDALEFVGSIGSLNSQYQRRFRRGRVYAFQARIFENGKYVSAIAFNEQYFSRELPKAKALGLLASSANTCTTYLAILV